MKPIKVYVAGPMGIFDKGRPKRIHNGIVAGEKLRRAGLYPFVPHLDDIWGRKFEHSYECWMRYDKVWLELCDALLRIPGKSPGADREVVTAYALGIPVFHSVNEVIRWADAQNTGV